MLKFSSLHPFEANVYDIKWHWVFMLSESFLFFLYFLVYSTILKLVIIFIVSNVSNKELFACRLQCSFLFALARLLFLILCVFSFLTNAPIIVEILTRSNVVTGPNKLHIPFWKSTAHTHTQKKIHFSTPNLVKLKCNVLFCQVTAWECIK